MQGSLVAKCHGSGEADGGRRKGSQGVQQEPSVPVLELQSLGRRPTGRQAPDRSAEEASTLCNWLSCERNAPTGETRPSPADGRHCSPSSSSQQEPREKGTSTGHPAAQCPWRSVPVRLLVPVTRSLEEVARNSPLEEPILN